MTVTEGAVSDYSAEDPNCKPRIITAGYGYVEPGNHVAVSKWWSMPSG